MYPRAGGWQDQPLSLLVKIEAIGLVVTTMRFLDQKDADWTKLTATQAALVHWLEADNG